MFLDVNTFRTGRCMYMYITMAFYTVLTLTPWALLLNNNNPPKSSNFLQLPPTAFVVEGVRVDVRY